MVGLVKERRRRKRMGTGLEIGQGWVIMKMENWVSFGCLCFARDRGRGCRTDSEEVSRSFLIDPEAHALCILCLHQWPPICPSPAPP